MTRERVINMIDCILGDNILCDCIEDSTVGCNECRREAADIAINALKEQKTGKWIKDEEQSKEHTEPIFICSCCQNNSAWGTEERTRYCSFCGAKMEVEE